MINKNKGKHFDIDILTHGEVLRLIDAIDPDTAMGIRNRAFVVVLYRAMLRISEALNLYEKDLDPDNLSMTVQHGKGDKRRVVGMDEKAWRYLDEWLVSRSIKGLTADQPVFCTRDGKHIATAYFRDLLPRLAYRAGIRKRVHPHALRHAGATDMRRSGTDIAIISKQLGHSSVSTTDRYINSLAPGELLEQMRRRAW